MLAGIVVQRKKLCQSMWRVSVHMIARRAYGEDERMSQHGGDTRIKLHRVVLRPFHFRLVNRNRRGLIFVKKELTFVVGDRTVHRGIRVRERYGEMPREFLAQFPHGARQEIALAA